MLTRSLGALAVSAGLLGCTAAQYHKERLALTSTEPFKFDLVCQAAAEERIRSQRRIRESDREELQKNIQQCVRAAPAAVERSAVAASTPDSKRSALTMFNATKLAAAVPSIDATVVRKQHDLFQAIYDSLPTAWFEGVRVDDSLRKAHVEVTARNPQPPKDAVKPFIVSLSDRGQLGLIEFAGSKGGEELKPLDTLIRKLRGAAKASTSGDAFEARTEVPLLISASFNSHYPADRLEKLYIFIRPLGGATIADVEKPLLETVKGTVALAKETTTEELTPTAAIENLLIGSDAKGKLGLSGKFGRTLERTLTKQFALRSVALSPERDYMVVRQEGQEGIDISGNVLSTITLQLPSSPAVLNMFAVAGKEMITRELHLMHNVGDVDALVTWVGLARIVESGRETISEEDDVVRPRVISGQYRVNLWRNYKSFFTLKLGIPDKDKKCFLVPLVYHDETENGPRHIAFKELSDATRLKELLISKAADRPLQIKVKQEDLDDKHLRIGFPVGEDGKAARVVNLAWQGSPATERMFKELILDIAEPGSFPIRLAPEPGTLDSRGRCIADE